MATNDHLLSVSSNDKTVVAEQNSSKPHSANLKISIPARQRKESFESECSTVDSYHMSVSDDLNTSSHQHHPEVPALSPRSRLSRALVSDYVCSIDSYLRKIEKESQLKPDHLARH
jgi:Cyclin, N-terminal domain